MFRSPEFLSGLDDTMLRGSARMRHFMNSIRVRIIIAVILMISVPFVILQITNMVLIYDKLRQKTVYTTEALSRSIATNVSEFMNGAYDSSKLLSENDSVVLGNLRGAQILGNAVNQMPYFRQFYVQKSDGMQTIRSGGALANRSDRWWFRKAVAEKQPFVSGVYISVNENELVTSIFIPMLSHGELKGIFGADLTLDAIQKAAGQYWNKDISYIIMDSNGSVLTSTDYQSGEYINYIDFTKRTVILDKNHHYTLDKDGQILTKVEKITLSPTMKQIITNALNKKTQSFQFKDSNNDIVVCAYQPIQLPGKSDPWSVIVFQKQTDHITNILLAVMFLVLISLSVFVTLRLINKSVLDPVLKIQQDMSKIAEGSLDVRIDIPQSNELGELASDIDKMVGSLKYHQQRLDEDEKMAALGNLVAGVAHEINTPLGIGVTTSTYMQKINNESRLALVEGRFSKKDLLSYMETMNDSLDMLQFNLERGSNIIQSFKRIAVDQTTEQMESFQVKQYIDGIVISLLHEYKNSGHTIDVLCSEELIIKSYPGVYAQILTNFIMNSLIHAFKDIENGKMIIEARRESDQFILVYSDNGCGISEETRKNLFTPFYTTNKKMGGSGLGLSIVYNLITKKLNGKITVDSGEGKGIRYVIKVPVNGG